MRVPKPEMKKARIEIIPMIDAIFFLLVFFMFSSLSMIRLRGANVTLPAPATSSAGKGAGTAPPKLILSVTDKGAYFLNAKKIDRDGLQDSLQTQVTAHPNSVVVVNMAKTQTTQNLIDVLDTINKVNTPSGQPAQVLIATEPVDEQGQPLENKGH